VSKWVAAAAKETSSCCTQANASSAHTSRTCASITRTHAPVGRTEWSR
jgi:hypothetical protein